MNESASNNRMKIAITAFILMMNFVLGLKTDHFEPISEYCKLS